MRHINAFGMTSTTTRSSSKIRTKLILAASSKQLFNVSNSDSVFSHRIYAWVVHLRGSANFHPAKSKTVSKKSSYTVSFVRQVAACTKRELWLFWGDKTSLYTKFFIIISNALIVSSLFYGQSLDTSGAFSRGGTLFFSILFLGWLQLTELMPAVSGRTIIGRHKDYAFYRPSAVSIARVVVDFPVIFAMVAVFTIIVYFMTGLDVDVSKYWIYALFVYTTTFCITSLYRMFASLSPTIDDAVRFSGIGEFAFACSVMHCI